MKKLGRREYLKMICETLVQSYGNTLVESDTDLAMAVAILKKMRKYLYFHSMDMTPKEWVAWRRKFLMTNMNRCEETFNELGIEIKVPGKLQ